MNTVHCPQCRAEITVPKQGTSAWVIGILSLFVVGVVGVPVFIIICLAMVRLVGTAAEAEMEEANYYPSTSLEVAAEAALLPSRIEDSDDFQ